MSSLTHTLHPHSHIHTHTSTHSHIHTHTSTLSHIYTHKHLLIHSHTNSYSYTSHTSTCAKTEHFPLPPNTHTHISVLLFCCLRRVTLSPQREQKHGWWLGMGNILILSYIVILRAHDNHIVVVLQLSSYRLHIISGAFA